MSPMSRLTEPGCSVVRGRSWVEKTAECRISIMQVTVRCSMYCEGRGDRIIEERRSEKRTEKKRKVSTNSPMPNSDTAAVLVSLLA